LQTKLRYWQTEEMSHALDQVGARLRAARHARGWTLEELATPAGVSVSTLSRLESGKRQASLELLLPLTRRLGIRIDDPLPTETRDPDSPMQALKIVYPPMDAAPAACIHEGYEWLYVLSGRVRLALDGSEHALGAGEAAEFDTRLPHSISATADGPAEVLSIFSASGERFHTRLA